jgi:cell division protein FtsQ
VVSRTSAARFAARARARRWWSRRWWSIRWWSTRWWSLRVVTAAVAVLAVAGLAGWAVLVSPLLAVREVGVVGAERIDPSAVTELAAPTVGTPLARVDTAAVETRVLGLPLVKDVDVVRAWPRTLEVRLVERVPIAAVPAGGAFHLVDAEAVIVAEVADVPADLPIVDVDLGVSAAGALRAAASVLTALPEDLRADVEQLGAGTPDDVRMRLRDGGEVVWGAPTDSELKSRVLQALRSQEADVYDVSAPLTPVTR